MTPRPTLAPVATRRPALLIATALAAALVSVLVSGCASPPDRYYTLAAPVAAPPLPGRTAAPPSFIEIAPIAMPERLARPQLVVTRPAPDAEVELLEQHRWSSSFENELRDALGSGVASRLGAVDLTRGGRQPGNAAWRISVQVRQFDAVLDTRIAAAVSWSVRASNSDQRATCVWSATEPVGAGIGALAQGAQRVASRLADAIAQHVAALQAQPGAACPG